MGPWAFGPLVLVSALGLLLNAYVLIVVLGLGKQTQLQQQTANTLLLIHLGAVEFAVCTVLLIFTTGPWTIAGSWCVIHGFLLTLLHPVALWTVTGLNCDRYYAIAAPLHYTAVVSPRRVISGLIFSWAGAILLCLPPFLGLVPPYKYSADVGCCIPDFGNTSWGFSSIIYAAIYVFFGLILPAVLVTICNIRILGIARYHRHRIASAIYEVTLSAQVTITHQRNPFFVPTVTAPAAGGPPKFHSAASTVMQLIGSIYLLYFPFCGFILWEASSAASHSHLHAHPRLASLASLLLASSPPINGLLYGLKSRTLRRSVQNYWRKKVTKSELQQEIQARTPSVAGSRRPSGSGPVSLFPFPPLQRRLSEALLNLGTNSRNGNSFDSRNIETFHRSRLQPAVSCNTLRVPTSESSGDTTSTRLISTSTTNLLGYHNDTSNITIEPMTAGDILSSTTSRRSPRILITRTFSVETPDGCNSPLLKKHFKVPENSPTDRRRWRYISTGSDSSTGSSDASIWTTGVVPKVANWPVGKRFTRVREEDILLFTNLRANSSSISDVCSSISDATDTTATTTSTLPSKMIFMTEIRKDNQQNDEVVVMAKKKNSDSEPSWSSTDEENEKELNKNNKINNDINIIVNDNHNDKKFESSECIKKYRKIQNTSIDKDDNVIHDEKTLAKDRQDTIQLRPLLTSST